MSESAQELLARLKERQSAGAERLASLSFKGPAAGGPVPSASAIIQSAGVVPELETGEPDSTVVLAGSKVIFRGIGGCCLSVVGEGGLGAGRKTPDAAGAAAATRFRGGAEGNGFGDPHECLALHNRHARGPAAGAEEELPIRYGDRIMVRSRAAREKCLAPGADGSGLVFEVGPGCAWDAPVGYLAPPLDAHTHASNSRVARVPHSYRSLAPEKPPPAHSTHTTTPLHLRARLR